MTAGQTIKVTVELDWTRPNINKSFSVSAWSTSVAVTLAESTGAPSNSYYLAGNTPAPPIENCSANASSFQFD